MKNKYLILDNGSVLNCEEIVQTKYFGESDRYYVYTKSGLMSNTSTVITKDDFDKIRDNFNTENEQKSSENEV